MTDDLQECWDAVRAPPHDRFYEGVRNQSLGKCRVTVRIGNRVPKPLRMCLGIVRHSPNGFEWGYSGSGPAQLALAILVDALGATTKETKARAVKLHQPFKKAVVTALPQESWVLTREKVLEAVAKIERADAKARRVRTKAGGK